MNKGKSDLSHLLSVEKHTTDKTSLGYNKQTTFSKKNQVCILQKGEPKQGLQKEKHSAS